MSDWKIEMQTREGVPLLAEVLIAQRIWKRLSKPAQTAVRQLAEEVEPSVHPNTMHALARHGFVEWDEDGWNLTDAGKRVAKWSA